MMRRLITATMIAWLSAGSATFAQQPQGPGQPQQQQPPPPKPVDPPAGHAMPPPPAKAGDGQPREPVPPVTDADRAAAFPRELEGHAVHDRKLMSFVLFEKMEWQGAGNGGLNLDNNSWFGGDVNRLWLRTEIESERRDVESASVDALFGHSFSRWWDVVGGLRQDFKPGDPQTWAAIGIQGLAPMWFDVEATAYAGADGRTAVRLETEYDLLLTNRFILQPRIEIDAYGKADEERGLGAGLSSVETGLRLRYEFRREFAPYVGVTWERKLFGTADFARADGRKAGTMRLAFGLRTWF